jgi:uncharacterized protein with von Willebrand factor type A (vWA) domain
MRQAGQSLTQIVGLKDKVRNSSQVIDSFNFDKEIYADVFERSPVIQDVVAEGDAVLRTFPDMSQDMYMALYKHKPVLLGAEDVTETHQFNHKIMNDFMETEEFKKLRSKTRLDMIGSALGLEVMSNAAVEVLKVYAEELRKQKEDEGDPDGNTAFDDINDAIEGQGPGQGQAPGFGSGSGQGQGGGTGGGGQGQKQGNNTSKNQANQQNQNGQGNDPADPNANHVPRPQISKAQMDKMMEMMQQAASQALDDVQDTRDFLNSWGLEGGDPNNRITYEDKKRALARLRDSDKLKKLTDMVGRMKKLAINEQKQKAPEGAEAIKSVKTGNRIEAVLPSEKALLASSNQDLKGLFYRKFNDKELLEYDMDVYESMGKGPMIVCVDTSGSMSGQPEMWSKAVALALLEVANKQKRNYACIHFDGRVNGVWEIPFGQLKPDDVFDIAERFSGGGTDFERPLRKAMEIMNGNKFKKGDVVFITDGDCMVSDEFLKEFAELKKQKEFKVQSVLVNVGSGGGRSGVKEFSDKIINLSDLAKMGEVTATDIFRNV